MESFEGRIRGGLELEGSMSADVVIIGFPSVASVSSGYRAAHTIAKLVV